VAEVYSNVMVPMTGGESEGLCTGMVTDPFGHSWQMATHVEDVTPEEMAKRAGQGMGE
jgi:hypothetical protein